MGEDTTLMKERTNRLGKETSPYLLQHARNPVDWYPWCEEAFQKAKREKKPVFLSIGYSACHWCHVMERESFEDQETANYLNQNFVSIKVDREERQDIDHIYMSAVQMLTQHGGWPLSVFLTPEKEPFYGGTYFPKDDRGGMPSFRRVLQGIVSAWTNRKDELVSSARQLTGAIQQMSSNESGTVSALEPSLFQKSFHQISTHFDPVDGGFGGAPKFFHTGDLKLALREWHRSKNTQALSIVTTTLDKIAAGGVYDQLGGGFHRYSTDKKWFAPHFEKMLYDNALLADVYLEAFQATRNQQYARIAREILDYVLRDMTSSNGAFFSAEDADSEGEEGTFYSWEASEFDRLLGIPLSDVVKKYFGVTTEGNWEHGKNILHQTTPMSGGSLEHEIALAKRKLLHARDNRERPQRDEKILLSWNGLMIHAMAFGYQVLGDETYLSAATRAAKSLLKNLHPIPETKGIWRHSFKDEKTQGTAFIDDYANFISALITLYESDFDPDWLKEAKKMATQMIDQFWDSKENIFFFTAKDQETLIARPRDLFDGAMPSGHSVGVTALIRLGKLLREDSFTEVAEKALSAGSVFMNQVPTASSQLLLALHYYLNPKEIVLAKDSGEIDDFLHLVREEFIPSKVVAMAGVPLAKDKPAVKSLPTLYLCQNFTCEKPITDIEEARLALKS